MSKITKKMIDNYSSTKKIVEESKKSHQKAKLEQFKELNELFNEKAEQIALLKNKYSEFTPINYSYINNRGYDNEDKEWNVIFVESSRCGDEEYNRYISEEEILTDLDVIEEKLKIQQEKKLQEKERIKKEKEEKEKAEQEKRELYLYNQLKNKFEKNG